LRQTTPKIFGPSSSYFYSSLYQCHPCNRWSKTFFSAIERISSKVALSLRDRIAELPNRTVAIRTQNQNPHDRLRDQSNGKIWTGFTGLENRSNKPTDDFSPHRLNSANPV
jgi:hypothetical protein